MAVPASPREMLVGERVHQLWNACVASRRFVERSWHVDSVLEADLADVKARMAVVVPGRIAAGGGAVAEYEKAFLVSGGNFAPLVEKTQSGRPVEIWRRYGAWSIAAILIICLGATWMLYQEQLKSHEALRLENIRRVKAAMPAPAVVSCIAPKKAKEEACHESIAVIKSPVTMRSMCGCVRPGERAMRAPAYEPPMSDGYGTERYAELTR